VTAQFEESLAQSSQRSRLPLPDAFRWFAEALRDLDGPKSSDVAKLEQFAV
jgi:hypothetical protein